MSKRPQKQSATGETPLPRPANREDLFTRKVIGNLSFETAAYGFLILFALIIRLVHLSAMPLHHDESIHAKFTYDILRAGNYHYDPAYHGPFFYYYNTVFYLLFGDSDFTARLGTALLGVGLIGMALGLRPFIGKRAALFWAAILTMSPTYIYFSRFLRHDMYISAIVTAGLIFIFRYVRDRKPSQAYMVFVCAGLLFVTKEDAYIIAFIFTSFPALFFLFSLVTRSKSAATEQWSRFFGDLVRTQWLVLSIGLILFALIWVTFYTALFSHPDEWNGLTKALTYWWGQHTSQRVAGRWFYYVPRLFLYESVTVLPLLIWLFAKGRPSPVKALLYGAIGSMAAYAAFEVARIGGASWASLWTKLFLRLGILVGISAALYTVLLVVRGRITATVGFFTYWALLACMIYFWAGEKVPWLLVPILLPLTLLASIVLTEKLGPWWVLENRSVLPWVLAILCIYTLYSNILLNFLYPAFNPKEDPNHRHAELMVYVQSTMDTKEISDEIHAILAQLPKQSGLSVAIEGQAVWPLSWYLRRDPVYWAYPEGQISYPVIIVDPEKAADLRDTLKNDYDERRFQVRAWWVAEPRNAQGQWVRPWKVLRYIFTREVFSGIGSTDAVAFIQKDLSKAVSVSVHPPPPTRGYDPAKAIRLQPLAIWGEAALGQTSFREPRGLAVAPDGSLLVADSKNHRIAVLGPDGKLLRTWGTEGSDPGQLKEPGSIAVDDSGKIYVADTWNHRIQTFTPEGRFLAQWGKNVGFWGPRGIAVSKDHKIYVTDTGNKRVIQFDSEGRVVRTWGGAGNKPGAFIEPVGIAVDDKGTVYVADTGNRRVQVFDPSGTFIREFPVAGWTNFYTEPRIAIDLKHRVLVVDSSSNTVARYLANGALDLYWGKPGEGKDNFKSPMGIALGGDGTAYISDTINNRIAVYRLP